MTWAMKADPPPSAVAMWQDLSTMTESPRWQCACPAQSRCPSSPKAGTTRPLCPSTRRRDSCSTLTVGSSRFARLPPSAGHCGAHALGMVGSAGSLERSITLYCPICCLAQEPTVNLMRPEPSPSDRITSNATLPIFTGESMPMATQITRACRQPATGAALVREYEHTSASEAACRPRPVDHPGGETTTSLFMRRIRGPAITAPAAGSLTSMATSTTT